MQFLFDQADFLQLASLKAHCRQFITSPLLNDAMSGAIGALLGGIHIKEGSRSMGRIEIKDLLEISVKKLKKNYSQNILKIIHALAYLGETYKELGQYKKAKEVLEESLALCNQEKLSNSINIPPVLVTLGNMYRLTGQYEKGGEFLLQGAHMFKKFGSHALASLA
jgi:tetratricopeptide (TPR) repeat protein